MPSQPSPVPSQPARPAPFGFSRVVFLSHVNRPGMPVFPGDPEVQIRPVATVRHDGFYLQYAAMGEQSGTHWAAPCHFSDGAAAADMLDPVDFFRPAVVLDVRALVARSPDFTLGVDDIRQFEASFGRVPAAAIVIMWTGFDQRWSSPADYLNADTDGIPHYPGFGREVTAWLVAERGIGGLGIDTLGIDPGIDAGYGANRALLHEHRIHLENLTGLGQMPPLQGWIIVGGVRNQRGSGSPATIFGLVP